MNTYTTVITIRQIEGEKSLGNYRRAGELRALLGLDRYYGCHYGMRSTRDAAKAEFEAGYDEVNFHLTHGDRFPIKGNFASAPLSPLA